MGMYLLKTTAIIVVVIITVTVVLHMAFRTELPKGHKACRNACTLADYLVEEPSWFGYYCPVVEDDSTRFCFTKD